MLTCRNRTGLKNALVNAPGGYGGNDGGGLGDGDGGGDGEGGISGGGLCGGGCKGGGGRSGGGGGEGDATKLTLTKGESPQTLKLLNRNLPLVCTKQLSVLEGESSTALMPLVPSVELVFRLQTGNFPPWVGDDEMLRQSGKYVVIPPPTLNASHCAPYSR